MVRLLMRLLNTLFCFVAVFPQQISSLFADDVDVIPNDVNNQINNVAVEFFQGFQYPD